MSLSTTSYRKASRWQRRPGEDRLRSPTSRLTRRMQTNCSKLPRSSSTRLCKARRSIMPNGQIQTSRDLADALEEVIKVLRTIPEFQVHTEGIPRTAEAPDVSHNKKKSNGLRQSEIAELAELLPGLGRSNAEQQLSSLSLQQIRELAKLLEIRVASRTAKSETVNVLLAQLFDMPSGQELIRTFHKRNPGPSDSADLRKYGTSDNASSPVTCPPARPEPHDR